MRVYLMTRRITDDPATKLGIARNSRGLVIVTATPKGYEELGRKTVLGRMRQAPALAGGLLYLHDDRDII
jgi:hypothetical protein